MAEIIRKVKNFSKSKLSFSTPHLLTMQKETWEDFWKVRVKELLEEISPIRDYTGKEIELWFGDYKLGQSQIIKMVWKPKKIMILLEARFKSKNKTCKPQNKRG